MDDGLAACGDEVMYKDFIAAMSRILISVTAGSSSGSWVAKSSRIVKRASCASAKSSLAMTCG